MKNYTVKRLKESFAVSGRLDAEYYQEKYDRLFEKLHKFEVKNLSEIAHIKRGEFINDTLYNQGNIDYIRGTNITGFAVDDECVKVNVDIKNYKSVKKNDLVFAMIGSVGEIAVYTKNSNAIVSNNLGSMTVNKEINSYYVFLVLNTIVGKMQFEKYQTRTAQPKIALEDMQKFAVPILPLKTQEKISGLLRESENLRTMSKALLQEAVRKIEAAIEGAV